MTPTVTPTKPLPFPWICEGQASIEELLGPEDEQDEDADEEDELCRDC